MNKLIINLALTGGVLTRDSSRHLPLSLEEIVDDACKGLDSGASILHLHAREDNGAPSYCPERYANIIRRIRAHQPEAIITVTTSGRKTSDLSLRTAALYLDGIERPDMASLMLGSMNFHDAASINEPETICHLAKTMLERGIKPELEVFDLGMIHFAKVLIKNDLLRPPYYFNIILGNIATAQADLLHLATLVRELPSESIWALGGLGRYQHWANNLGVIVADGVRTGLEDNIWLDAHRSCLASNRELLRRVVDVARSVGREIATPSETRQRLGLETLE